MLLKNIVWTGAGISVCRVVFKPLCQCNFKARCGWLKHETLSVIGLGAIGWPFLYI